MRTYTSNVPKGRRGRVILIDAHSLIYRAFFALPPMSTSDGRVTNAVYGFTSMLAIVLASRPEFAIAAFDLGKPTFRSVEYKEYKAGRRAMPDDLRPQIEKVREVLEAFTIPIYAVEGFEADDVIGTLARIGEERGHAVTIVSGDLDCLQLVTESVEALVPRRGITDTVVYGPDQVRQRRRIFSAARQAVQVPPDMRRLGRRIGQGDRLVERHARLRPPAKLRQESAGSRS